MTRTGGRKFGDRIIQFGENGGNIVWTVVLPVALVNDSVTIVAFCRRVASAALCEIVKLNLVRRTGGSGGSIRRRSITGD